jgi:predicted DNA-binding transcriptional regulator AlpA
MPSISSDNVSATLDPDCVMPLPTWCKRCGFSEATGRRLIKIGQGPTVTWLSKRRMGIREKHHREWLDSRAEQVSPRNDAA